MDQSEHGRSQSDTENELSTKKDIAEKDNSNIQSKGIDTQNGVSSLEKSNRKRKRSNKHMNIKMTELANFEQSSKKSKESNGNITKQSKKKQKKKKRNCRPVTSV